METRTFIASGPILPQRELTRMVNEVSDDVVGFGPIEFLLKDPDVTEVRVDGPVALGRGRRIPSTTFNMLGSRWSPNGFPPTRRGR